MPIYYKRKDFMQSAVESYTDLPTSGIQVGEIWAVTDDNTTYMWVADAGLGVPGWQILVRSGSVITILDDYTVTTADKAILVNAFSKNIGVDLPTASTIPGMQYDIKKIDASMNTVTVYGYGSEEIDGDTTAILTMQYEVIRIRSDGANWWIM